MRKAFIGLLVFALIAIPVSASGSGESAASAELSPVEEIIQQAEGMSMEELAKKAIEESNGKMFYGVGNSSRGKSSPISRLSILTTRSTMSGSSRRTTRSSISSPQTH